MNNGEQNQEYRDRGIQEILENAPIILFALDKNGICTLSEGKALQQLGRKPGETVGRSVFEVYKDVPAVLASIRRALAGENHWAVVKVEETYYRVHFSPEREASGAVSGVVGVATDITEQKKAEADLKRSNYDLEQFAYIASHDLQEPLRMISSYAELLAEECASISANGQEFLRYVQEGCDRMQHLIRDLLMFSRVGFEGGDQMVNCETVLLIAKQNLARLITESKAVIVSAPLPMILGNTSQLIQLFQNILENAIKYRGERQPEIRIDAEKLRDDWEFSISDNGIGFNAVHSEKIFQIFQRLQAAGGRNSGSGIGLAVAKRIVENHGGRIWAESAEQKGSTFKFTVPAK
jgi:PAS domain S-box-containing protein